MVDKDSANRYQQLFLTPNNNKSNLKLDRKIGRFQVTGREVTLKSRGKRPDKDPILPILRDSHHFARHLVGFLTFSQILLQINALNIKYLIIKPFSLASLRHLKWVRTSPFINSLTQINWSYSYYNLPSTSLRQKRIRLASSKVSKVASGSLTVTVLLTNFLVMG